VYRFYCHEISKPLTDAEFFKTVALKLYQQLEKWLTGALVSRNHCSASVYIQALALHKCLVISRDLVTAF
jgi:hypothetical protein